MPSLVSAVREVDLADGRGRLRLALPEDAEPAVIRQRPLAPVADPRPTQRLQCDLRLHPAGSERPLPAAADRDPGRGGHAAGADVVDVPTAAVARSMARSGDRAVAVIPDGPYVVPWNDAGRQAAGA